MSFLGRIKGTANELIESISNALKVSLHDGYGNPIGSLSGALNIHDADVHNSVINDFAHQHTAIFTTLTANTLADGSQYQIQVLDATGFTVGDYLHINTTTVETTHPILLATTAATGPATFTLDRRLDKAHLIGDEVRKAIIDMSILVGTLASPQEYVFGPPAGEVWHITRLLLTMVLGTAGDLGLFGNLPALTNGLVLRAKVSGQYGTFTNWKTNGDIAGDMYDISFDARSGGGGSYGARGRGTFTNAGAVIRLDGTLGDRIEVYIQDDITSLDSFDIKFQGHKETE